MRITYPVIRSFSERKIWVERLQGVSRITGVILPEPNKERSDIMKARVQRGRAPQRSEERRSMTQDFNKLKGFGDIPNVLK